MGLYKYNVINPVKDTKLPFFDEKKGIFYIPISKSYRYYVEVTSIKENGDIDYILLLSSFNFDVNCRKCHTDNYGRVQVKVRGKMKDYIVDESKERGNLEVNYLESTDNYDVFIVR